MELARLEDLSAAIVVEFELMKKREQQMRDTNGKLNQCCKSLMN